jgi:hypothetical protein
MEIFKEIKEAQMGEKVGLSNIFDIALEEVFSKSYLNKIKSKVKKDVIDLKDFEKEGETYSDFFGRIKIRINPKALKNKNMNQKIGLLMHEFIHYLQEAKTFFIIKKFKEIMNLTERLYEIVKDNLVRGYSIKDILPRNASTISKYEILAYFIEGDLNWKVLSDRGKKEFLETIVNSGIFNLTSRYIKNALSNLTKK